VTISELAGQLKNQVRQLGISASLLQESDEQILERFSHCECGEAHLTRSQLKHLVQISVDKQDFLRRRDDWNFLECQRDPFGHGQRKKWDWDEDH
jgi:hypothetical protein